MSRPCCWKHSDGDDAGTEAIAQVLMPFRARIASAGPVEIYSSEDFKKGIDNAGLVRWADMLGGLTRLDPRGGYYEQGQVSSALHRVLDKTVEGNELVARTMQCPSLLNGHIALKIRVMLAHARIKYDSSFLPDNPLAVIFKERVAGTSARREKRDARLGNRPHPFPFFRVPEESDDEEATIASATYNAHTGIASILYSDGTKKNADTYRCGAEGFAEAHWADENFSFDLDVPNSYVVNGKIDIDSFTAKTKKGKKRPAADIKAAVLKKPACAVEKAMGAIFPGN